MTRRAPGSRVPTIPRDFTLKHTPRPNGGHVGSLTPLSMNDLPRKAGSARESRGLGALNRSSISPDATGLANGTGAGAGMCTASQAANGGFSAEVCGQSAVSVVMRLRVDRSDLNSSPFVCRSSTSDVAFQIRIDATTGRLLAFVNATSAFEQINPFMGSVVSYSQYFVLGWVFDAGTLTFYANGSNLSASQTHGGSAFSATTSGTPSTAPFTVPESHYGPVSEVAVFDRALSDADMIALGGPALNLAAVDARSPRVWLRYGDGPNDADPVVANEGVATPGNLTVTAGSLGSYP